MEAHNRLAGIIALCERRIGQELRTTPKRTGGDAMKACSGKASEVPPKLSELGITYDQSAAYQQLAHEDVAENVILDAIAAAGAEGRPISKADIQRAVKAEIERKQAERGEPIRASPRDPEAEALYAAPAHGAGRSVTCSARFCLQKHV
jgi:hypothetical protein